MSLPFLATAFYGFDTRIGDLTFYTKAVTDSVLQLPLDQRERAGRVFAEGIIVLAIAHLEDFLQGVVGMAARPREKALRRFLAKDGTPEYRAKLKECAIPELVKLAKKRITFKQGKGIEALYRAVFGCSPWPPDDDTREVLMDLARVRHVIVHNGSADVGIEDVGPYVSQLRLAADVFNVRTYGEFTTYTLKAIEALRFYMRALLAMQSLKNHLQGTLGTDTWLSATEPASD
jgi:hypothetical protein